MEQVVILIHLKLLMIVLFVINNEDGYNLEFARSLVHECGHLFELEHLY